VKHRARRSSRRICRTSNPYALYTPTLCLRSDLIPFTWMLLIPDCFGTESIPLLLHRRFRGWNPVDFGLADRTEPHKGCQGNGIDRSSLGAVQEDHARVAFAALTWLMENTLCSFARWTNPTLEQKHPIRPMANALDDFRRNQERSYRPRHLLGQSQLKPQTRGNCGVARSVSQSSL